MSDPSADDSSPDEWMYDRNGQLRGPVSLDELARLASQGQLAPSDGIWQKGMPRWVEAGTAIAFLHDVPATAKPVVLSQNAEADAAPAAVVLEYGTTREEPFAPGGFWRRSIAWCLDAAALFIPIFFVEILLEAWVERPRSDFAAMLLDFVPLHYFVAATIYACYFWNMQWQATPGMLVMDLYVARPDGTPIGIWRAIFRQILVTFSFLAFGIGILIVPLTHRKRALHDLLCDTVVIHGQTEEPAEGATKT